MATLCPVCRKGDTNSRDGICVICTVFDKEKVAEYKAKNSVPEGDKPETSTKKSFYGFNWQAQPNTQTRIDAIERAKNKAKRRHHASGIAKLRNTKANCKAWLCRAEAKIADRLDAIGESAEILKVLEVKENENLIE